MGGAERGQRLVPDVFDELEGSWGQAAIHVKHKGNERAALLLRVGSILANFVLLTPRHGFPRGHVNIGGGVRIHPRDVKVYRAAEHVDLAVRQKVGQVLLYDVGGAVIAAREAAKQLAAVVVPLRDSLALELCTAERVPGRSSDVLFAEGAGLWHVVQRRQAQAKACHDGGAEVSVDGGGGGGLHPSLSGLVPARGKADQVGVGALRALEESVEVVVEKLLRERSLQALELGDALVVRDDLCRMQR